jgi:hypothetical protein
MLANPFAGPAVDVAGGNTSGMVAPLAATASNTGGALPLMRT